MVKKMYYKNRKGYMLDPGGFKRLNGGKNLSKSQVSLLRFKRIFVEEELNDTNQMR